MIRERSNVENIKSFKVDALYKNFERELNFLLNNDNVMLPVILDVPNVALAIKLADKLKGVWRGLYYDDKYAAWRILSPDCGGHNSQLVLSKPMRFWPEDFCSNEMQLDEAIESMGFD